MVNHDWIRAGVKAELIKSINYPELDGTVVTIKAEPEPTLYSDTSGALYLKTGVELEESYTLAAMVGLSGRILPLPDQIIPHHQPPDWEAMSKVKELETA